MNEQLSYSHVENQEEKIYRRSIDWTNCDPGFFSSDAKTPLDFIKSFVKADSEVIKAGSIVEYTQHDYLKWGAAMETAEVVGTGHASEDSIGAGIKYNEQKYTNKVDIFPAEKVEIIMKAQSIEEIKNLLPDFVISRMRDWKFEKE